MILNVYVPAKLAPQDPTPHFMGGNRPPLIDFLPGSAIVSDGEHSTGRIKIDYEGNKYGAANLFRYVERVMRAADRQLHNYPTIARAYVMDYQLTLVGTYDTEQRVVRIAPFDLDRVKEWLGMEEIPESELVL